MRTRVLTTIIAIMILGGCKKGGPVNFTCRVADTFTNSNVPTLMTGNATTGFNYPGSSVYISFQVTMVGPSNQTLAIIWYNLDSAEQEINITPGTYTMANYQLTPPSGVSALYNSGLTAPSSQGASASVYSTGYNPGIAGPGTGGTVTITKNTGRGGVISGTFTFNVINQSLPYDTAYITQGSFTDVPVVSQ